jgi:hypothetical protein
MKPHRALKRRLKENDRATDCSERNAEPTASVKTVQLINNLMTIRIPFAWDITPRQWVIGSRRFEANILSALDKSSGPRRK